MKKVKKVSLYVLATIFVLIIAGVSYVNFALPNVGKPEEVKVISDSQHIAHGKYLALHVAVCVDCHSSRDWNVFAGPVDSGHLGMGGELFDKRVGFPGKMYSANITSYNLQNWTDGEMFRAITCGVKKDGSAIFPLMPWQSYSKMQREDIYDIISFIRTLAPVEKKYPKTELDFPLNLLVNTMPEKASLGKRPPESDTIAYGGYLVQTAACKDCHTQMDKGKPVEGTEFAGGRVFLLPGITLRSANITTDKEYGLGAWTKQQFVNQFKQYTSADYKARHVGKGDFQTIMPWLMYAGMKTSDLESIYAYLQTLKPKHNKVTKMELRKEEGE